MLLFELQSETNELARSCFETYASLIRWVFKGSDVKVSDQEALATGKLLQMCYSSVSKLLNTLKNNETSSDTLTAATAHLIA